MIREAPVMSDISQFRAFIAVLRRDLYVTGKELPTFAVQVMVQPVLILFVFGRVLSNLGYTHPGYSKLLFPGIVGMTVVLASLQSTALPLVFDFSFTKEIEDRLLAPLDVRLVAIEKIVFASMRGLVAGLVMFPIGILVLGSIPWRANGAAIAVFALILGAIVGSAVGLVLGTLVPPTRINLMFAVILTPLLFSGCVQYPWSRLGQLRWFQVVTTLNPITYVTESMRAALNPSVGHINTAICFGALVFAICLFTYVGVRGFLKRALD